MTDVENLKKVKAVINDLPCYMDYLPTEEQNEAFDVVLKLLNEAIEKATVLCKDCKHYKYGICKKAGLCVNKSPNGFCDWGEVTE